MNNINNSLISTLLMQVRLIEIHQNLAKENRPNQLPEMIDALSACAEAIGNANALGITSIDEDSINVLATRYKLESETKALFTEHE